MNSDDYLIAHTPKIISNENIKKILGRYHVVENETTDKKFVLHYPNKKAIINTKDCQNESKEKLSLTRKNMVNMLKLTHIIKQKKTYTKECFKKNSRNPNPVKYGTCINKLIKNEIIIQSQNENRDKSDDLDESDGCNTVIEYSCDNNYSLIYSSLNELIS